MGSIIQFFSEVKSELSKVIWPSRQDTLKYTTTVILFSCVVAAILGAVDYGLLALFQKLLAK